MVQRKALQLPLLGQKTRTQLTEDIYKAVVAEATDAEFYSRLMKDAPNELHRDFIEHARNDEMEHLEFFEQLYEMYTGKKPRYEITPITYSSYKEALQKALIDELEAVEFYRDVQMSDKNPLLRDVFYYAVVDELEHATRFGTLLNM